jgi:hypothetical protein
MTSYNIGHLEGAISTKPEATYGTDPADTGWTHHYAITSTVGLRRTRIVPPLLSGYGEPANSPYGMKWVDGDIKLAWSFDDRTDDIINSVATKSGAGPYSYVFNTAPTGTSFAIRVNHGGLTADQIEYLYTGCYPTAFQWDMKQDNCMEFTASIIGQSAAKEGVASTLVDPGSAGICMPDELTSATIGGTAVIPLGAMVRAEFPFSGTDRPGYGTGVIKEPVEMTSRKFMTTMELDLGNIVGDDTQAEITALYAGTDAAGVTIVYTFDTNETLTLGTARPVGDPPALTPGVQSISLTWEAASLAISHNTAI